MSCGTSPLSHLTSHLTGQLSALMISAAFVHDSAAASLSRTHCSRSVRQYTCWSGRLGEFSDFSGTAVQHNAVFTSLHGMQRRLAMRILSVCLSVCPSVRLSVKRVHCDKTKKNLSRFLTIPETIWPSFLKEKNGWWGRPLLPETFGQPAPR